VIAGIVIGAALVMGALMLVRFGHSVMTRDRHFVGVAAVALLIAASVVAVVIDRGAVDATGGTGIMARNLPLNDIARVTSGLLEPQPVLQQGERVASVPSLIDGLRQRLQRDPDDARGWALLAQSYAFIGETDLAEQAVDHAVAHGFDESDLRQRVAGASRDPHAGLPGFAAAD